MRGPSKEHFLQLRVVVFVVVVVLALSCVSCFTVRSRKALFVCVVWCCQAHLQKPEKLLLNLGRWSSGKPGLVGAREMVRKGAKGSGFGLLGFTMCWPWLPRTTESPRGELVEEEVDGAVRVVAAEMGAELMLTGWVFDREGALGGKYDDRVADSPGRMLRRVAPRDIFAAGGGPPSAQISVVKVETLTPVPVYTPGAARKFESLFEVL